MRWVALTLPAADVEAEVAPAVPTGIDRGGTAQVPTAEMDARIAASPRRGAAPDQRRNSGGRPCAPARPYKAWHDPHNNGTYTKTGPLAYSRLTGDGKRPSPYATVMSDEPPRWYTDKQTFTLTSASSTTCKIEGCSESQVTSGSDFGQ
eukprot:gene49438-18961_t